MAKQNAINSIFEMAVRTIDKDSTLAPSQADTLWADPTAFVSSPPDHQAIAAGSLMAAHHMMPTTTYGVRPAQRPMIASSVSSYDPFTSHNANQDLSGSQASIYQKLQFPGSQRSDVHSSAPSVAGTGPMCSTHPAAEGRTIIKSDRKENNVEKDGYEKNGKEDD